MSEPTLADHLARAGRALERIERAVAERPVMPPAAPAPQQRDEALRAAVRDVVAELDALIRDGGTN